jgi:hypothetical protein
VGWGDPQTRRDLLGQLFDALDVEDGAVAAILPRSDRAAEVAALMERVAGAEREVCGARGVRSERCVNSPHS